MNARTAAFGLGADGVDIRSDVFVQVPAVGDAISDRFDDSKHLAGGGSAETDEVDFQDDQAVGSSHSSQDFLVATAGLDSDGEHVQLTNHDRPSDGDLLALGLSELSDSASQITDLGSTDPEISADQEHHTSGSIGAELKERAAALDAITSPSGSADVWNLGDHPTGGTGETPAFLSDAAAPTAALQGSQTVSVENCPIADGEVSSSNRASVEHLLAAELPLPHNYSTAPRVITFGDLGQALASVVQTSPVTGAQASSGLVINIIYDSSAANAPAGFQAVVNSVVQFYESQFSNPITLNIHVGWGEVDGQSLGSGALGESESFLQSFSYAQIRNAMIANATSSDQLSAVNSLPTSAPVNGTYYLTLAEATALGLLSGKTTLDGYVGFSSSLPFAYNNSNGVPAGEYDFYGVVAHEISEVMGRISMLNTANTYSALDLFRFTAAGAHSFVGTTSAYFSADGGGTNLNYFNSNSSGDFGDWANSAGNDSYDAFSSSGSVDPVTAADIAAMNVLGYNFPSQAPPIPAVSGIVDTPSNADLNAGKSVSITLDFNAPVTVTGGTPKLALNDGGTAFYASGSGSAALTFTYTVSASDSSMSSLAVNSVNLNGATIANSAGNAQLSLSGLTQSGPQIDTTIPTLSAIVESPSGGTVNVGQVVVFTLDFQEPVNVSGNPTLALNDGGMGSLTGGSGTNKLTFSYTVSTSDTNVQSLIATAINLNAGTIVDGAGNDANLSFIGLAQAGPKVNDLGVTGIVETPSTGDLNAGKLVTITIDFNTAVTVAGGTPTLVLNDGGTATYSSGSGGAALNFTYTVGAGDSDVPSLAVTSVALNGATIADASGSAQLSLSGLTQAGPQIDTTIPTLASIVESGSGTISVGQVVVLTLDFTEAVNVSGAPILALNDGGTATFIGGSASNKLMFSYTVSTSDTSVPVLTVTSVNGGSIEDGGGNSANLTLAGLSQTGPQVYIPPPPASQIDAIYQTVLQRAPTSAEMKGAVSDFSTFGLAGVADLVVDSPEAQQNIYPVAQIITLATGVLPTEAQLATWVPALQSGTSLQQMALAFVASTQFGDTFNGGSVVNPDAPIAASIVSAIIQAATGVAATQTQVNTWVNTGLTIDQVFVDFALGQQYSATAQSTIQQYLTRLTVQAASNGALNSTNTSIPSDGLTAAQVQGGYEAVLQRAPTSAETNAALSIDATIGNVASLAAIVDSPEAQQNVYPVAQIILLATGHLPTAAQLGGWVPAVESGTSLDQIALAFVASTAFGNTYNGGTAVNPNAPITAGIVSAIIQAATGVAATQTQINTWVSTGLTIDQVFVDFALGDQYSAFIQGTVQDYLTAAGINAAGLTTVDGINATGALTLGTTATPLTGNDLTMRGGSGVLTVVATGTGDTITELNTSTAGGVITANGNNDIINAANGANTITANGSGDTITLGVVSTGTAISAVQTVHASSAGDTISFATKAADGTAVTWAAASTVDGGNVTTGIGANSTVNFSNNTSGGSEAIVVTGDLTGATTAGGTTTTGIAMITLGNVHDAAGDQIILNNAATEILAGSVNVSSATSLAHAFDMAAADAAASQTGGKIAANSGVIDWFQYNGNTYVLEAINSSGSAATHGALALSDELIKIVGMVGLGGEAFAGHTLTL